MGSRVGKGIAETFINDDASVTYEWSLRNGTWSHCLSPDRSWNWFRDECGVESPQFVGPGGQMKFRIGLKEPTWLASIIAYAKLPETATNNFIPKWEILIGDAPSYRPFSGYHPRTYVGDNISRRFFFVQFWLDPPINKTLTIRLTLVAMPNSVSTVILSQRKKAGVQLKSNSFCPLPIAEDGRRTWRADIVRLLSSSRSADDDESDYYFDVTLIVEGSHHFRAHRCVLAWHSPVFAAMFRKCNGFKESRQREVAIKDITAETMTYLLQYFYNGHLTDTSGDLDGSLDARRDEKVPYIDLLAASERYDLKGLKHICEWKLAGGLTSDNVCELIVLADTYSATLLKTECLRFVEGREARVGRSDAFGKLARQSSTLFKELCSKLW